MILSLYYLAAKLDVFGETTMNNLKDKTFLDLLYAGLLETWFGGWSFDSVTWTMCVEFWASWLIYFVAFTGYQMRGRFIYYYLIIIFLISVPIFGYLDLVRFRVNRFCMNLPYFLYGLILADMENLQSRPLDRIRDLHWGWKV